MATRNPEGEFERKNDENFFKTVDLLKIAYDKEHNLRGSVTFPLDSSIIETHMKVGKLALTEQGLLKEWERVGQIYLKLGFHKELEMSSQDYLSSLPTFAPQPEAFSGRFDVPILAETRISPQRQAKIAGLGYFISKNASNWGHVTKIHKTPDAPYTAWMQTGEKYLDKGADDVLKILDPDERSANIFDGLALLITNKNILNDYSISLPGTVVAGNKIPYLNRWKSDGAYGIGNACGGIKNPRIGTATCGITSSPV